MKELPVTIHECARLDVVGRRGNAAPMINTVMATSAIKDGRRISDSGGATGSQRFSGRIL